MAKAAQDAGLSVDGTVKSMMDLQQKGALISSKVLPHFAKRLRDAAQANGGLEKAMLSNRVAMNRMTTSMQMAADKIFRSGLAEGLTKLFNSTAKMIKDNQPLWESLGKTIGGVLKGISFLIDNVVAPALSAFGSILTAVTDLMGNFSAIALVAFSPTFWGGVFAIMKTGLRGVAVALAPMLFKFTAIATAVLGLVALLEELSEFFSPTGKKTLIGTNFQEQIEPFNEMIDKTMGFFGMLNNNKAVTVPVGSENPLMLKDTVSRPAYTNQSGYGGYQGAQTITVPVNIDGQKVAEVVAETPAMQEAMRKNNSQNTVRGLY
ncbi:hypothetical protein KUA24_46 [Vibrio phage HNL01]|nr:hypothetical protein KUA24_46 [Vibrio phage HNL01]